MHKIVLTQVPTFLYSLDPFAYSANSYSGRLRRGRTMMAAASVRLKSGFLRGGGGGGGGGNSDGSDKRSGDDDTTNENHTEHSEHQVQVGTASILVLLNFVFRCSYVSFHSSPLLSTCHSQNVDLESATPGVNTTSASVVRRNYNQGKQREEHQLGWLLVGEMKRKLTGN